MSRRCQNCGHWTGTNGSWATCAYASTGPDCHDEQQIARAKFLRSGDEKQATLETHYSFGCAAWKSISPLTQEGA